MSETSGRRRERKKRANGQGSIYQRADGMWVGAAYVLMPDGSTRRRPVYGSSEDVIRKKLTELQSNSDQGIPADATGWTVEKFLTVWLAQTVKPNRQPNTYVTYEKAVRIYLVPGLGKKRLNKLTAADVRQFIRRMENTCLCCARGRDEARPEGERRCCALGRCCERRPSKRQVQVVHAVLRNALQAAVREELVRRNVAKLVQVSTPRYGIDRGLTVDQAHTLLDAAAGDRLYALLVLALFLGMRRGELLGLQWSDIDEERKTLTVRHTLQRVGGELRLLPPKTEDSERTLPLLGLVADALTEHRKLQDAEREAAGKRWVKSGHVFTTRIGTAIEPDNLRRFWLPLRQAAGLDGVVFHGLRHTCVTLLLDLGVPPHIVREIAGHSAIEVTMTIYAHASMGEKRRALGKLDKRLTGPARGTKRD
ncbi:MULTISPECIES: site-specific integrase [Protofrankia]|uniref:Integrase n=1 Tax=Protofrankia coriariae TaxID=1562887 RepID=A0ABR5F4D7_9ACTN|nr:MULTISPECIES: site-specific integrase [Protofrankia]KLL11590.1 integrase [Protofrankia coriariae]ONH35729.1 site-specific integrase [Protofrankia sp. BMG5.30]